MPTILARLGSTRPLLAYALCYFCGLALVTCKFSTAFCFRFCFVPELKQSEAPASSQTAQDPKLCATRNPKPNASYDSCCCCLSCCLCWHVARSRSWSLPLPLVRKPLWFCPSTLDCLALKGLECLKWTCGIFQSVHSRRMCVKYPQCDALPVPFPFPFPF